MADHPHPYTTDRERWEWYPRFTLEPADPEGIEARLASGESLRTLDLPTYLSRKAITNCETGVGLYRLVQLWGTPNVPGLTAGAIHRERDHTTWQYLFDVSYDRLPADDPAVPDSFQLSVYDYKTDISAGLSAFSDAPTDVGTVHPPGVDQWSSGDIPPTDFLTGVVGLVLNMVDEAVPATFKELWV